MKVLIRHWEWTFSMDFGNPHVDTHLFNTILTRVIWKCPMRSIEGELTHWNRFLIGLFKIFKLNDTFYHNLHWVTTQNCLILSIHHSKSIESIQIVRKSTFIYAEVIKQRFVNDDFHLMTRENGPLPRLRNRLFCGLTIEIANEKSFTKTVILSLLNRLTSFCQMRWCD